MAEEIAVNPISADERAKLDNNFTYHAPKGQQVQKYGIVRDEAKAFAETIHRMCPPSRERSVALTELETAVMWANAAIARNE